MLIFIVLLLGKHLVFMFLIFLNLKRESLVSFRKSLHWTFTKKKQSKHVLTKTKSPLPSERMHFAGHFQLVFREIWVRDPSFLYAFSKTNRSCVLTPICKWLRWGSFLQNFIKICSFHPTLLGWHWGFWDEHVMLELIRTGARNKIHPILNNEMQETG